MDIKLGMESVCVSAHTYARRVGWVPFFFFFFLLALFTSSESCQIGNYCNGQSLQISGHFSAKRYQNGKLPSELPRPLQDRSANEKRTCQRGVL